MDVFSVLRRDHETASSMFKKIQADIGQRDTLDRHDLFRLLKEELEHHAKVADLHVDRVYQQAEPTRDGAVDALEEHRKIKTLLDDLSGATKYDFRWVAK